MCRVAPPILKTAEILLRKARKGLSTSSCVNPFSRRIRAKFSPMSLGISIRGKMTVHILSVYKLQYVSGNQRIRGLMKTESSGPFLKGVSAARNRRVLAGA